MESFWMTEQPISRGSNCKEYRGGSQKWRRRSQGIGDSPKRPPLGSFQGLTDVHFVRPSSCEVLTSPLSTALTTVEIMEAGFTIIASVGHSLKGFQNNLMTHAQANAVPLCIVF
jgi:hypothetical protein